MNFEDMIRGLNNAMKIVNETVNDKDYKEDTVSCLENVIDFLTSINDIANGKYYI